MAFRSDGYSTKTTQTSEGSPPSIARSLLIIPLSVVSPIATCGIIACRIFRQRMNYIWLTLLSVALIIVSASPAQGHADCSYDREALTALDERSFDQDPTGGWRKLANVSDCLEVAADLIRDYRELHRLTSGILYWHEGQLRAMANHYDEAVPLLEKSRKPPLEDDAGWNLYVDATVAFLQKDSAALERARQTLAVLQPSGGIEVEDGFVVIHGNKTRMRWPANLDVVDGLRNCFWKSYSEAYGIACHVANN